MKKQNEECRENNAEEQDVDYESCSEYDEEERKTNFIAHRIKDIAIIIIIIGIIAGIIMCTIIGWIGILVTVGSIIPAIFIYGFGEIIQLLEDIKNK